MKKTVILFVLALVMVLIGSCAAQSANNIAQRIVGTWTQVNDTNPFNTNKGTIWIFKANGTGTQGGSTNFNYGISSSGEIYLTIPAGFHDIMLFMSPDGKRMFLGSIMLEKIKLKS
jgi:hypothetical protein